MPSVYRAKASFFSLRSSAFIAQYERWFFKRYQYCVVLVNKREKIKYIVYQFEHRKLLSGIKYLHCDTQWSVTISIYFIAYDNTLIKFKIHIQEKLPLHTLNHDKSSMKQLLPFVLQSSDIQRFIIFFNQAIFSGQRYLQSFVIFQIGIITCNCSAISNM